MSNVRIRASYDSFRDLRENDAYYIDKTDLIEEYLIRRFDKALLFARPRRFGKTLTMTMMRDFLDIRQDSRDIFSGLKIMDHPDVVNAYMNQYPVIFLSLKEVFADTFEGVFDNYRLIIANYCKTIEDIITVDENSEADKEIFRALVFQRADEVNTVAALDLLSRMLNIHYGKQVFIIIDEYDVPMAKALGTPYYDKVRDMVEHMLSYVCKTNGNVKGILLSGCLYTVKNSTYTGVNNIVPYNPFVKDLKNALWAGETEKAQQALGQILEATLSFYHEYHEYSYHLILNGFFTGQGYRVLSETETGYGRSDLVVLDPARRRCLIPELKHVKK